MLLCILPGATAEEAVILDAVDLNIIEEYAAEQGMVLREIIQSILSGELPLKDSFLPLLAAAGQQLVGDFSKIGGRLILPMLAILILRMVLPRGYASQKTILFICRLCCISALAESFVSMRAIASTLLSRIVECTDILSPAMLTAVTLAGAETTAAFLSPMSGVCVQAIQHILSAWGIALASAAAGIAIAGNFSEHVQLKRLGKFIKQIVHTGVGGILAAFITILSLQGKLGAGRDTAAARTSRYAIESVIPVIGGNVSDSLDSLLSTAFIVKNALGAGACILIACTCLIPMARLMGTMFFLRLTAAVSEPLGDNSLTAMIGQFSDAIELLLIICVAAAVLCGLLMGSGINAASNIVR